MKITFVFALLSVIMISCVSNKKYKTLDSDYKKLVSNEKTCQYKYKSCQNDNRDLVNQNNALKGQVEYLKQNSNHVLNALYISSCPASASTSSLMFSARTPSPRIAQS